MQACVIFLTVTVKMCCIYFYAFYTLNNFSWFSKYLFGNREIKMNWGNKHYESFVRPG